MTRVTRAVCVRVTETSSVIRARHIPWTFSSKKHPLEWTQPYEKQLLQQRFLVTVVVESALSLLPQPFRCTPLIILALQILTFLPIIHFNQTLCIFLPRHCHRHPPLHHLPVIEPATTAARTCSVASW